MRRVFVSYSHAQAAWVKDDLCAVLRAGGAEVLVDHERFTAGRAVVGQMDATQDQAEVNVLVLSTEYQESDSCMHELRRAVASDPTFETGRVIPVVRGNCALPREIKGSNPLYVDVRDASVPKGWTLLLGACEADIGCAAPDWLDARRQVLDALGRDESVNLVVRDRRVRWRALIADVQRLLRERHRGRQLGAVDLESGAAASRRGLLEEILRACGSTAELPPESSNQDLVAFTRALRSRSTAGLVALQHFDRAVLGDRDYGMSFFAALRDLVSNERKLCLLIHSTKPFLELLPENHALSSMTQLRLVELLSS